MILSPEEREAMLRIRLRSSELAAQMTPEEVVAQVSASGIEWKPNPHWNGKGDPTRRVIPRIRLVKVGESGKPLVEDRVKSDGKLSIIKGCMLESRLQQKIAADGEREVDTLVRC